MGPSFFVLVIKLALSAATRSKLVTPLLSLASKQGSVPTTFAGDSFKLIDTFKPLIHPYTKPSGGSLNADT